MARVVKLAEARRGELLDCAQALFFEQGYDATTISDVIERAGISKGGFYHHFASKEEMLAALALRMAEASVSQFREVMEAPGLDAFARLDAYFARARQLKLADAPRLHATFYALFRPENAGLHHRILDTVTPVMIPLLERIMAQGKEEGTFAIEDPLATAEVVMRLASVAYDGVARVVAAVGVDSAMAVEELERRLRIHGVMVDRILGLPDGSVTFFEPGMLAAVMTCR